MNTSATHTGAGPAVARPFQFNAQNAFTTTTTAIKLLPALYYVDSAFIVGPSVEVEFTINDNWQSFSISLPELSGFVKTTGMNDYCFDRSDSAGEHVQDAGTVEMDTYLDENLELAVKAYLQARKIGQYHLN